MIRLFPILLVLCCTPINLYGAAYPDVFLGESPRAAVVTSGAATCDSALKKLDTIITLKNIDPYLLEPEGAHPLPDFSSSAIKFDTLSTLLEFYNESARARGTALSRLCRDFFSIIQSISSLSHTHSEFEILSFFTENPSRTLSEEAQRAFIDIFKEGELDSVKILIERLKAVSLAIDSKEDKSLIKAKESAVTESLESLPTLIDLANSAYIPAVKSAYEFLTAIIPNHETPEGRLALTRLLIQYGELVKTIPSKKAKPISKKIILFRDKAVKVLPRRLDLLNNHSTAEVYAPIHGILREFHRFIFEDGGGDSVPADPIVSLLRKWGYKANGDKIAVAAAGAGEEDDASEVADTETFLKEILGKMRDLSTIKMKRPHNVFYHETSSVNSEFSKFSNHFENLLRTLASEEDPHLSPEEKASVPSCIENLNQRLREEPFTRWPVIMGELNFSRPEDLDEAFRRINSWLSEIETDTLVRYRINDILENRDEASIHPKLEDIRSSVDKIRATRVASSRLLLGRLLIKMRQADEINTDKIDTLDIDPIMITIIEKLPPSSLEALRVLGYVLAQSVLENESTLPSLDPFKDSIRKLRNYWAHTRITPFEWEDIIPTLSGSEKTNECAAIMSLIAQCEKLLSPERIFA